MRYDERPDTSLQHPHKRDRARLTIEGAIATVVWVCWVLYWVIALIALAIAEIRAP